MKLSRLTVVWTAGFLSAVAGQDGCKVPAFLTDSSGMIESPYYQYPQHQSSLPTRLSCRWTISNPNNNNLLISFAPDFAVDIYDLCNYEALYYFSGPRKGSICSQIESSTPDYMNDTLIYGPLCKANGPPDAFILPGSENGIFTVEFCTDSFTNFNLRGFRMFFNATSEQPSPPTTTTLAPPENCGGSTIFLDGVANKTAIIESPGYPSTFASAASCRWNVSVEPGSGYLQFIPEEMDVWGNCQREGITIVNGATNQEVVKWCRVDFGEKLEPVRVVGNAAMVTFTNTNSGFVKFRLRVQISRCENVNHRACPNDPNGDSCYSADMFCDGTADCPDGEDENCSGDCGVPAVQPWRSDTRNDRVFGGKEARPHSFPWHVALFSASASGGAPRCAGAIIDHRFILTSGDCCYKLGGYLPNPGLNALVGEHDLSKAHEDNIFRHTVERAYSLPQSYPTTLDKKDLCLMKTSEPMFFNRDVSAVCLSIRSIPVGTRCYLAGWGGFEGDRWSSERLRQTEMIIRNPEECLRSGESISTSHLICAGGLTSYGCYGDDGGALVCPTPDDSNRWEVVGIFRDTRCEPNQPQWFTKVSTAVDWIADTIFMTS